MKTHKTQTIKIVVTNTVTQWHGDNPNPSSFTTTEKTKVFPDNQYIEPWKLIADLDMKIAAIKTLRDKRRSLKQGDDGLVECKERVERYIETGE